MLSIFKNVQTVKKIYKGLSCKGISSFQDISCMKMNCVGNTSINFKNVKKFCTDTPIKVKNPLVWIDMEMTGLNIEVDHIIELACIITDSDLNVVVNGPELVIHQSDDVLKNMNEWCLINHEKSGLVDAVKKSKITITEAEDTLMSFLEKYIEPGKSPLAGNCVMYDRMFLDKYMPKVNSYLHYRNVDVSTVNELCWRWLPVELKGLPKKKKNHRALDDILESISELRYYQKAIFNVNKESIADAVKL